MKVHTIFKFPTMKLFYLGFPTFCNFIKYYYKNEN